MTQVAAARRMNQLDGSHWKLYSISVWDIVKTREEARLGHPAIFPLELPKRLVEVYTRPSEVVLDPFAGSGSTLVAALELGRRGVGLDISPDFVELAKMRLKPLLNGRGRGYARVYHADARRLLDRVRRASVDLCVTSPPYWNIHRRRRTSDYKEPRPYSHLDGDLGNIDDYGEFLGALGEVFGGVRKALKPGKRCVMVAMDIRVGPSFIPFHLDLIGLMRQGGYSLEDIIVWDRRREYNNLRPLGYPSVFVVNKVHEYIMVFNRN